MEKFKPPNLAIFVSSIVAICTLLTSFLAAITAIDSLTKYFPFFDYEGGKLLIFFFWGVLATIISGKVFLELHKILDEKYLKNQNTDPVQDYDNIEETNDPNERERVINEIENNDQKDNLVFAEKHARLGEYVKAQDYLDKSEKYATGLSDIKKKSTIIAKVEKMRGTIDLYHGEFEQSKLKYERSRKIASDSGDDLLMSQILSCLGLLHRRQDFTQEAIKYFQDSRDLKKQINDKKGLVYVYRNLGAIESNVGSYNLADNYFMEAMKFANEIELKFEKGQLLSNMAFHEIRKGNDLNLAKRYCEDSIQLKKAFQSEKRYLAYSYEAMGIIEMRQENYLHSEQYLKKSLQLRVIIEDYHGMKRSRGALLSLYKITGNEQKANIEENSIYDLNIQISSRPRPFADMIEGLFENNLFPKISRT